MGWKCPRCGIENESAVVTCHAMCGYVHFGRLVLVSTETGREIRFNLDSSVGRSLLAGAIGDDCRYVSDPQFHLRRSSERAAWVLENDLAAANPTTINGESVCAGGSPLATDDNIMVGKDKAPLRVRIER